MVRDNLHHGGGGDDLPALITARIGGWAKGKSGQCQERTGANYDIQFIHSLSSEVITHI
ncbi:hypothetical protein [Microbulbifer sp. VAAF005]|uniref:hypothetical protein n=1 Tax=Microbulbifer sp. VAAF005 TaxID=3034230 RepID=UPI0024ACA90F|nr:hypothetical protein [Microbulbifer sp. VAAF005]WHI44495.1 hypothetical protein P0078_12070 [Microbulbifer sp. VAAF005]